MSEQIKPEHAMTLALMYEEKCSALLLNIDDVIATFNNDMDPQNPDYKVWEVTLTDLNICFEILKWKCKEGNLFVVHTITRFLDGLVHTIRLHKEVDVGFEVKATAPDLHVAIASALTQMEN